MSTKLSLTDVDRPRDRHRYCLLRTSHISKDVVNGNYELEIVDTDMNPEYLKEIKLDQYIQSKLEKNLVFEAGSLSILPTVVSKNTVSPTTTCYFSSIIMTGKDNKTWKYIVCLTTTLDNEVINLFRFDIEKYVKKFKEVLETEDETKIRDYLSSWFSISVEYLSRTVDVLSDDLDVFLHACLIGKRLVIQSSSERHINDFTRLSEIILLTNTNDTNEEDTEDSDDCDVLCVEIQRDKVLLSSNETNDYCKKLAYRLRQVRQDPTRLRQYIERSKLKLIQELNHIRRLVDLATVDNYALYEVFTCLNDNLNKDVLLVSLLKEKAHNIETQRVLEVVYNILAEIDEVSFLKEYPSPPETPNDVDLIKL